ncbi:MAG: ATP-binding protein [Sulfuricurvum sp.]|nr:ATP-binding protein [Sulfuricurvum sp.]
MRCKKMLLRLQNNSLFQQLKKYEKEEFGLTNFPISNNIENHLINVASQLLNRISSFMPEYTSHNIEHCLNILDIIAKIIPSEVRLNIVELQILIYSVILHDIGMVVNREEAEKLKSEDEFFRITMEYGEETDDETILTEYIRRTHVERSLSYIDIFNSSFSTYKIDFTFREKDITQFIKTVIRSHEKPVDYLRHKDLYPQDKLISKYRVNIQFIAILLRLGDIMDFDINRTPYFLFKHIGIKDETSLSEWKKHLSIDGYEITSHKIEYQATCYDILTHRRVQEFLGWIEHERKESMRLLEENGVSPYFLLLKEELKFNITPIGYKYNDLVLHLDYEKILQILMGTNLYDSTDMFLRELLQNSYDACRYRNELLSREQEFYSPAIQIRYDSVEKVFLIEDNGIGINDDVFKNFVISIGRSFYKSRFFARDAMQFSPISNFGIGIISCFMVSEYIEIDSLKENCDPIHFTLHFKNKFIEEKEPLRKKIGTLIKLRFHDEYAKKIEQNDLVTIIKDVMSYQPIPISVSVDDFDTEILNNKKIRLPDDHSIAQRSLFFEFEDSDIIEGYMMFIGAGEHQLFSTNKIAQQCFVINGQGSNINLAPTWLSNVRFNINIPDSHKIQLKASRSKIESNDPNLLLIKKIIMQKIINIFRQYEAQLDKEPFIQFFSFYASDGRARNNHFLEIELDFLMSIPLFLYAQVLPTEITFSRKNIYEIAQGFKNKSTTKIAIVPLGYMLNENGKIRNELFAYLLSVGYDFILISEQVSIHYFYQCIEPYVISNILCSASDVSGLTYNSLTVQNVDSISPFLYSLSYTWTTIDDHVDKYFCLISNNQYNGFNLIAYNKKHRLGSLLEKYEELAAVKSFKNALYNSFIVVLLQGGRLNEFVWNIQENHYFGLIGNGEIYALKFQKCLTKRYIETLNTALQQYVLNRLIEMKEILSEDSKQYQLTIEDFPSWYFVEEENI